MLSYYDVESNGIITRYWSDGRVETLSRGLGELTHADKSWVWVAIGTVFLINQLFPPRKLRRRNR